MAEGHSRYCGAFAPFGQYAINIIGIIILTALWCAAASPLCITLRY